MCSSITCKIHIVDSVSISLSLGKNKGKNARPLLLIKSGKEDILSHHFTEICCVNTFREELLGLT